MSKLDYIARERQEQFEALRALSVQLGRAGREVGTGEQIWRALRRIEAEAGRLAVAYCNGEIGEQEVNEQEEAIYAQVSRVLGDVPKGFFVNHDPRGYAIKLQPGSYSLGLHRDWGGYQILAPELRG